jgi:lipoprotein NlpI
LLQYNSSQWGPALENFRKSVALKCSDDSPPFYIWLIQVQTGKEEDANKELGAYLDSLQGVKAKEWQANIGHFLIGNLPESEFIIQAGINTNRPSAIIEQVSDAYFYAGMKHKLAGDEQGAASLFQKCLDAGDDNNCGNWSASAELRVLKQH